jgi:hypothetical protein
VGEMISVVERTISEYPRDGFLMVGMKMITIYYFANAL